MRGRVGGRVRLRRGRAWRWRGLAVLAVTAMLIAAVGVNRAGLEASVAASGSTAGESAAPAPGPVTFAAVGDSITNANSERFADLDVGDGSWVTYAAGPSLRFVGGWARGGAKTSDMVRNARPVHADVLVIIAGTNDLAHGVPFATISQHLVTIAQTVGATRVVVSAVPPRNATPERSGALNAELEPFVVAQGWTFVDAMAGVRDGDQYGAGLTLDGIHPDRRGAQIIGAALAKVILAVAA